MIQDPGTQKSWKLKIIERFSYNEISLWFKDARKEHCNNINNR